MTTPLTTPKKKTDGFDANDNWYMSYYEGAYLGLNVDTTRIYVKFQKIAVLKPEDSYSATEFIM